MAEGRFYGSGIPAATYYLKVIEVFFLGSCILPHACGLVLPEQILLEPHPPGGAQAIGLDPEGRKRFHGPLRKPAVKEHLGGRDERPGRDGQHPLRVPQRKKTRVAVREDERPGRASWHRKK